MMKRENEATKHQPTVSILELLKNFLLRRTLILCVLAMISQQITGFAFIVAYSSGIFASAGLVETIANYSTVALLSLLVGSSMVSMVLMDYGGRRLLLIAGCTGCALANIAVVCFMTLEKSGYQWCKYGSLVCLLCFIIAFAIGPANVPWVLVPEMFPTPARGAAMMVVISFCYGSALVTSFIFPILQLHIGQWTFLIFAVLLIFLVLYFYWNLVETRGKSFTQIQKDLTVSFQRLPSCQVWRITSTQPLNLPVWTGLVNK